MDMNGEALMDELLRWLDVGDPDLFNHAVVGNLSAAALSVLDDNDNSPKALAARELCACCGALAMLDPSPEMRKRFRAAHRRYLDCQ